MGTNRARHRRAFHIQGNTNRDGVAQAFNIKQKRQLICHAYVGASVTEAALSRKGRGVQPIQYFPGPIRCTIIVDVAYAYGTKNG